MNSSFVSMVMLLVLACPLAVAAASPGKPRAGSYVPGELLVKYRESEGERVRARLQAKGMAKVKDLKQLRVQRYKLPASMTVEEGMALLAQDPSVEYVEPNYLRKALAAPDDTHFPDQWPLHNTGQRVNDTPGLDDADIDWLEAFEAWEESIDGEVIIAVVDSGVNYSHPELSGKMWVNPGEIPGNGIDDDGNGFVDDHRGWNFSTEDNDPMDGFGHGTSVAGLIAAEVNNAEGIAGVSWNARIMPLRILDENGEGSGLDSAYAITYAVENGAKVINASYGGAVFQQPEFEAIEFARLNGVLVVAAAGNRGATTSDYPAGYGLDNIISVGASTQSDHLTSGSTSGRTVDLAAPGRNVVSMDIDANEYLLRDGTSFSAAIVSGIAGLVLGSENLSPEEVRQRIINTVDRPLTLIGRVFSEGRANANNALMDIPAAPTGLSVASRTSRGVELTWTDNYVPADIRFEIERRQGPDSEFMPIAETSRYATVYRDTVVESGTDYEYRIRAFNSRGNRSDFSPTASTVQASAGGGGGGGGCAVGNAAAPGVEWPLLLAALLLLRRFGSKPQNGRWKKSRL
jgi:subtilisin family serine protease